MKAYLKFGISTGLGISLFLLVVFLAVNASGISAERSRAVSGLFSILILVLGILFGLRAVKKENNGLLTYKIAVLTGIKMSLITALIVSAYSFLYCTLIDPGFTDVMVQETEKVLRHQGTPASEIAVKLAKVKQEFSTSMQVMQSFVGQSILGIVSSIIIALFLRTK